MGFKIFVNGDILDATDVNDFLMQQSVMVFADAAARTTALPTPIEGMVTYLSDTDSLEVFTGASFVVVNDNTAAILKAIIDAKGDLIVGTAADTPARLAVGTNEHRLVADSGETPGLKYVADTTNFAIAAKGDLLAGTAADTVAPLTVGTDGFVLTADSGETSGLIWAAAGASTSGLTLIDTATPSAAASVSFDNVFTGTYGNYLIVVRNVGSASGRLRMRLRASESDDTGTNYAIQTLVASNTTVSAGRSTGQTFWTCGGTEPVSSGTTISLYGPNLAATTSMRALMADNQNSVAQPRFFDVVATHDESTSYDGCTLFAESGTFTGVITIYGFEE